MKFVVKIGRDYLMVTDRKRRLGCCTSKKEADVFYDRDEATSWAALLNEEERESKKKWRVVGRVPKGTKEARGMIIEFSKPVTRVSPCGALLYAAMPALYSAIGRYSIGRLEAPNAVREIVTRLNECSMRSSGVQWRVIGDSGNNTPELVEGGWLVVDIYAKVSPLQDFYAARFRMRRKDVGVVEVDVIPLGNEPVGDA